LSSVDRGVVLLGRNDLGWLGLHNRGFVTATRSVSDFAGLGITCVNSTGIVIIDQPFKLIFDSQLVLATAFCCFQLVLRRGKSVAEQTQIFGHSDGAE
jgi:hypothetical protein